MNKLLNSSACEEYYLKQGLSEKVASELGSRAKLILTGKLPKSDIKQFKNEVEQAFKEKKGEMEP